MSQPGRQLLVPSRSGGAGHLAAAALLILATIPIESCASRMPMPYSDEGASLAPGGDAPAPAMKAAAPESQPAGAPSPQSAASSFDATVRPILASRCAPCHNPGGKMYDKLPFDDAKTVHTVGEGISRRLKGEDHAALQKWLASLPPADAH
jgi:hypothetical protein